MGGLAAIVPLHAVNFTLQSPGGTVGSVLLAPHLYFVGWNLSGHDPANLQVDVRNFLTTVSGTRWNGTFTEYPGTGYMPPITSPVGSWPQNTAGSFYIDPLFDGGQAISGAPAYQPPPPDVPEAPNSLDPTSNYTDPNIWTAAVHNEVLRAVCYFHIQNDTNAIVIVMAPPRKYPLNPQVLGAANHNWIYAGGNLPTAYVDLHYPGKLDRSTGAYIYPAKDPGDPDFKADISFELQHEINEAVTDPRIHTSMAGWDDPNQPFGGEVADLEEFFPSDLAATRDGNARMQIRLIDNYTAARSIDSIFNVVPGWSNFMAQMYRNAVGSDALPSHIDAATWAWSNNISSDMTYTPARFSISPTGHLMFLGWDNSDGSSSWQDWGMPAGVNALTSPAVTSSRFGQLELFALGQVPVNGVLVTHLFHRWTDNRGGIKNPWVDWGTLPAGNSFLTQGMTATTCGPNFTDIFAVSTAGQLWARRMMVGSDGNSTDSGWINLGAPTGGIASGPGAVAFCSNYAPHVRVYVISKTGKLCNTQIDGWGNPTPQAWFTDGAAGAPTLQAVKPAVANQTSPRTFDVIALDTNGNVWHHGFYSSLQFNSDDTGNEEPPTEYWENWGHPPGWGIFSPPAAASLASRMMLIDVAAGDGHVYELTKYMVGLANSGNFWVNQYGSTTTRGVAVVDD